MHRAGQEDDPLLQQARVDVVGALAPARSARPPWARGSCRCRRGLSCRSAILVLRGPSAQSSARPEALVSVEPGRNRSAHMTVRAARQALPDRRARFNLYAKRRVYSPAPWSLSHDPRHGCGPTKSLPGRLVQRTALAPIVTPRRIGPHSRPSHAGPMREAPGTEALSPPAQEQAERARPARAAPCRRHRRRRPRWNRPPQAASRRASSANRGARTGDSARVSRAAMVSISLAGRSANGRNSPSSSSRICADPRGDGGVAHAALLRLCAPPFRSVRMCSIS